MAKTSDRNSPLVNAEQPFVGAGLLAKAVFRPKQVHRMYRPHRWQASSHKVIREAGIGWAPLHSSAQTHAENLLFH
ncbi:hypothetical protein EI969_16570 [Pseudomonas sp. PB101]|nr:hypothetical protein [Pseudomonas sp. PB101]